MPRMKTTEDIQSMSAFRSNVAAFVEQVRKSGRPLVLTQHGRGAAVLLSAVGYEALMDELELLRDIRTSESQLARGEGIDHEAVARDLRRRVRRRTSG